jgi:beta-lactamase superfamily II metal-dependent hydrolase
MSKRKKIQKKAPNRVTVNMYDVGFGDCFLLNCFYDSNITRRVLIDCGSSSKKKAHMSRVIDRIIKDSEGHIDAIVATHRHKDHISAFGQKGIGEKLETLNPEIVIQPWTEHPDAKEKALTAPSVFDGKALNFIKTLDAAQDFALHLTDNPDRVLAAVGVRDRKNLTKIASLSIPNKKAILRLNKMGKKHVFIHTGSQSGLEELFPGVKITVLGPPTLKQSKKIRRQTAWDENEFWKLHASGAKASASNISTVRGKSKILPQARTVSISKAPSCVKWVIQKLNTSQSHNVKRIVRSLDNAINNTSIILLFEFGNKGLLFSGDAQLENWSYALDKKKYRDLLRNVKLYKVGHHGSTNATPKKLWALFKRRGAVRDPIISLLSTEKGHHSKVPRPSLVKALDTETKLESTQSWRNKLVKTYVL